VLFAWAMHGNTAVEHVSVGVPGGAFPQATAVVKYSKPELGPPVTTQQNGLVATLSPVQSLMRSSRSLHVVIMGGRSALPMDSARTPDLMLRIGLGPGDSVNHGL
jgi:hypothetical protein